MRDDFVGRVSLFVLAGQSNMSGRAEVPSEQLAHPRILVFGNDYRWKVAREPLDDPTNQVDRVSEDGARDPAGLGPGVSFALSLLAHRAEMVIGLIPCAKGDSTIAEWRRSRSDDTLYGSCLKRVRAASVAGSVSGLLFFQGEADALDEARHPDRDLAPSAYAERFATVVSDFRNDLSLPHLPLVYAQIGTTTAPRVFPYWALVRQQQQAIRLACAAMIPTDDLPLLDTVHLTADGYRVVGRRFAESYVDVIHDRQCG